MIGSAGLEGERALSWLLIEAAGTLDQLGDDAPARLADALIARLANNGEPPDRPGWLTFAAALVRPEAVHVCHAGDLRVQLVQSGAVVASTIDHTIGNEHPALRESPHRNVVARSLQRGLPPPDRATWPLAGPARLVIASYDVHGNAATDGVVPWPGSDFASRQSAGAIIELELTATWIHGEGTT